MKKLNQELKRKKKVWSFNKIKSFYFDLNFVNKDSFREMILNHFEFGSTYSILVRVEYNSGKYGMLGNQIGLVLDKENYLEKIDDRYDLILSRINEFMEEYRIESIDSVQVLFVTVNTLPKLKLQNINNLVLPKKLFNVQEVKSKYNSKLLPLTLNTDYFGKLIIGDECKKYIALIKDYYSIIYENNNMQFDSMYLYNNYIILNIKKKDSIIREVFDIKTGALEATFTDFIINDNTFERKYKDTIFTIQNDEIIKITHGNKILPLIKKWDGKGDRSTSSNPYIGTFDLEAFNDSDGFAKVYALGFCVLNEKPITFYLNRDEDKNLIVDCLNTMLVNKYNGYTFYIHNLNYDGVFILNKLKAFNKLQDNEVFKIKAFYKDNSILKLEVGKDKNKIIFMDSSNLLKGKLRDLCQAFNIDFDKGYFPYDFVNRTTLNYIGKTPSYEFWTDLDKDEYNNLIKNDWNLKEECLTYLEKDLECLLQIINLFNKYVFRKFGMQITNSLTISRLSLNIFMKDFIKDASIPLIKDNIYDDIKNAYYGGVTEVYKPYGENLYYYDVNSLYPFAAINSMCSNKYTYVKAFNEKLILENLFGFFYCKIETTNHYLGLLPRRDKGTLLMPNGNWTGWYFSEELKFAAKHGYKITVLEGYHFEKSEQVFDEYIHYLYNIKSTTKNKVEKSVMKSLLNNLLGRFGLNIYKPTTEVVNSDYLDLLISTRQVNSFYKITDNDYLVSYYPQISKDICTSHGIDYIKALSENKDKKSNEFSDVSLVISAAVTAYSRIYMNKIKLNILEQKGNIYYTDTDSIVTDIKLDDKLVGNDLGQFKLEYEILKGYFISSKTYCLVLKDSKIPFVCKSKGLDNKQLTVEDFDKLYNGTSLEMTKLSAIRNYEEGSVVLTPSSIKLNYDAFKKRVKILDSNEKWIDTKPVSIKDGELSESKDIKLKRGRSPPNILNIFFKIIGQIFMFLCSTIFVAFLGDVFNLTESNSNTSSNINSNLERAPKQPNLVYKKDKPFILQFMNEFSKNPQPKYIIQSNRISSAYDTPVVSEKVSSAYHNVIQELISHTIKTDSKFTKFDEVLTHSVNFLLDEMFDERIMLSFEEHQEVMKLVENSMKKNGSLLNLICEKELPSKRYNMVNQNWINKYETWVKDSESEDPGNMEVENQVTLLDEFEELNKNFYTILNEFDSINTRLKNMDKNYKSPKLPDSIWDEKVKKK